MIRTAWNQLLKPAFEHGVASGKRVSSAFPSSSLLLRRAFGAEGSDEVSVVFLDPLEVVEPKPAGQGIASMVKLHVPKSFVGELKHPREVPVPSQAQGYGEKDKLVNSWVFGEQVEAFEYHMAGSHRSKSGFSAALLEKDLEELKKAQLQGDTDTSAKFHGVHVKPEAMQALVRKYEEGGHQPGPLGPFLWYGKVEDSEKASGVHVFVTRANPEGADVPSTSSQPSTKMGGSMSLEGKVPGAKVVGVMVNQADRTTMGEY